MTLQPDRGLRPRSSPAPWAERVQSLAGVRRPERNGRRWRLLRFQRIYEVTGPRYALRCFATHVETRSPPCVCQMDPRPFFFKAEPHILADPARAREAALRASSYGPRGIDLALRRASDPGNRPWTGAKVRSAHPGAHGQQRENRHTCWRFQQPQQSLVCIRRIGRARAPLPAGA